MHESVKIPDTMELIDVTPVNPLISKCVIKVCYVGDAPNRNRSIITKDVAKQIAQSLPGSPIVGKFNTTTNDFEEHNQIITIKNGKVTFSTDTVPYGFVDYGAKVWFEKYDDEGVEHEYLCTEGFLWTGQFPECQTVIDEGKPQSFELDDDPATLNAFWTKDGNGNKQFFIINEAVVSKLCLLGDDIEPCFEGSSVTSFSLDDEFKQLTYAFIDEMKKIIGNGGQEEMNITTYAVELGGKLWDLIWMSLRKDYPDAVDSWYSKYAIRDIFEEGTQKFVIVEDRNAPGVLYRLNFTYTEEGFAFTSEAPVPVKQEFTELTFSLEDTINYAATKKEKEEKTDDKTAKKDEGKEPEGKKDSEDDKKPTKNTCGNDDDDEKKKDYALEDVVEYTELSAKYTELETKFNDLTTQYAALQTENENLLAFKNAAETAQKEELINQFYMLSEEDKQDVVDNISTYSLDDIKSKLCIICYEKKINFAQDDNTINQPLTYNLNTGSVSSDKPAWLRAVDRNMNKTKGEI